MSRVSTPIMDGLMVLNDSSNGIAASTTYAERIFLALFVGIVAIVGLIGNIVVILSVFFTKKMRTTTNIFVVSLSVADLGTCLCTPWTIVAFVSRDGWPLNNWVCTLGAFGLMIGIGCSIYTLSCIALIRLVLITLPKSTYLNFFSTKRMIIYLLLTWVLPFVMASLPLFGFGQLGYSARYRSCTRVPTHPLSTYLDITLSLVFYPIPFFVINYSYLKILLYVRRKTRATVSASAADTSIERYSSDNKSVEVSQQYQPKSSLKEKLHRREIEVTKNMFLVVCAFFICLTPYAIALLAGSDRYIVYAATFLVLNACLNPMVYATKHPEFKIVMRRMILCRIRTP